jgi:hypothetical protein
MMLLGSVRPAHAQGGIAGDWHGVLQSPIGPMTLIVTITEAEPGGLRGEMESPDQGPRRMPLSTLTATDRQLSFTIAGAQISYEGEWDEAAGQWAGVFTQGVEMPLVLRRGQPPPRPTIEGLDGLWQGIVRRNGVDLRLVLRVATGHRGTISTFDSPDIGVAGLPVAGFSRRGQTVDFTVPASGARFAGTLTDDGTAVRGTWTLPGQPDAAVAFTRVKTSAGPEARRRPQTPAPPLPYRLADVTFDNRAAPDVTLAGTLTLPAGDGPFPAAILITGSGPQDRDETLLGHKPFAVLADHLTRRGVAVLRYDDRGVARSTGDFASATSADFAADAAAAVQYLRTRSEIDRQAIGLIGHSEGGLVAPIAAADNEHVRFVVLLAGPGTNLVQLAQSQHRLLGLSQGASEAELTRMTPILADVFSAVAASESADDARARARDTHVRGARDAQDPGLAEGVAGAAADDRLVPVLPTTQARGVPVAASRAGAGAERLIGSPGAGRREPRGHQGGARTQSRRHRSEAGRPQPPVPGRQDWRDRRVRGHRRNDVSNCADHHQRVDRGSLPFACGPLIDRSPHVSVGGRPGRAWRRGRDDSNEQEDEASNFEQDVRSRSAEWVVSNRICSQA